jgi:hypothetical protein
MNPSASIATIEALLDSLEWWLTLWTGCVVLGLAIEYRPLIVEALTTRPFRPAMLIHLAGGLLVTAGVAGELLVGCRAASTQAELRSANANVVAELNREAEVAKATAEQARTTSKELEQRIAAANERASEANLSAEKERLARVQLEERLAPRKLSIFKFATLRKAFTDSTVRGRVTVHSQLGDKEALDLATQIRDALVGGGWQAQGAVLQEALDGVAVGLQLAVDNASPEPEHARVLVRALKDIGLPTFISKSAGVAPGEASLFVGAKPE